MPLCRALLFACGVVVLLAPGALAQQMPCGSEIVPLRDAVEKAGLAVKAAIDKKSDRAVICTRMKHFAAAEGKFVKYLETNQGWCSIPPEAVKQVKASYANTVKMRGQACATGPAAGQAPPPGSGLSEALGTARAPSSLDEKADRGTYNTLTGNPFQR